MDNNRIRCDSINYRQGFIEVVAGIHEGCINIETWQIQPDLKITDLDIRSPDFPDSEVLNNTEIELCIEKAKTLIFLLSNAVRKIEEDM